MVTSKEIGFVRWEVACCRVEASLSLLDAILTAYLELDQADWTRD